MIRSGVILILLVASSVANGQTGLKALLPAEGDIPGWDLMGESREYSGDDLFFLINGGADLFYEYGFREVIAATVVNNGGEQLKLEIYRMEDTFASYAVYLQKSAGGEESYPVGNNSFINGSSLGFWKHHYFVLIRGDHENEVVSEGMKTVAELIDSRIKQAGKIPAISASFKGREGRVTLLRGRISLSNVYYFTSRDLFRIEEGVAIEEEGRKEIWLHYSDTGSAVQRLGEAAAFLSREPRFSDFRMSGDQSFRMNDKKGNEIDIEAEGKYLKILIGEITSAGTAGR